MGIPDLFYNSVIQAIICWNLEFEDALSFRNYLKLPELTCPIPIREPKTQRLLILPGIDEVTIKIQQQIAWSSILDVLLFAACENGWQIIQVLMKAGVDPNFFGTSDLSALMFATRYSDIQTIKVLLEHGANINQKSTVGYTSLMWAIERDSLSIVQFLLTYPAIDLEILNDGGQTALILAFELKRPNSCEILRTLISAGANVQNLRELAQQSNDIKVGTLIDELEIT